MLKAPASGAGILYGQEWWCLPISIESGFIHTNSGRDSDLVFALSLLPLQAAAALLRAHSPEAMKLRANGMPGNVSVSF
jgi:hypothetical protein